MPLIWAKREAEYFCAKDWTGQISLIRLDKFDFTRNGAAWRSEPSWLDLAQTPSPDRSAMFELGVRRPMICRSALAMLAG